MVQAWEQSETQRRVRRLLESVLGPITTRSAMSLARQRASAPGGRGEGGVRDYLASIERAMALYGVAPRRRQETLTSLRGLISTNGQPDPVSHQVSVQIDREDSVVDARRQVRSFAQQLGFSHTDQIKLATVASELARNMYEYATGGTLRAATVADEGTVLEIRATDTGPGIPNVDEILSGGYRSKTGMGLGLIGCKRLMDEFRVRSGANGTKVVTRKRL